MENAQTILQRHHIKPSYTRLAIFRYLQKHKTHPTVDNIYKTLSKELPTLSKMTVYNSLKLFIEQNLVKELVLENQKHYDLIAKPHAHFKCDVCDTIYDIEIAPPSLDDKYKEDYKVDGAQLLYHGTCKQCLKPQCG